MRTEKAAAGKLKLTVPVGIRDISLFGVRLELSSAVRPGQLYDLKAELSDLNLIAQVRITRCSAGGFGVDPNGSRTLQYSAGAEFAVISDDQRKVLEQWIERMATARRPSSATISRVAGDF